MRSKFAAVYEKIMGYIISFKNRDKFAEISAKIAEYIVSSDSRRLEEVFEENPDYIRYAINKVISGKNDSPYYRRTLLTLALEQFNRSNYTDKQNTIKNSIVGFLLQNGADVNSRDGRGRTPLATAVSMDNPGIIRDLIRYGADINLQVDDSGSSLLEFTLGKCIYHNDINNDVDQYCYNNDNRLIICNLFDIYNLFDKDRKQYHKVKITKKAQDLYYSSVLEPAIYRYQELVLKTDSEWYKNDKEYRESVLDTCHYIRNDNSAFIDRIISEFKLNNDKRLQKNIELIIKCTEQKTNEVVAKVALIGKDILKELIKPLKAKEKIDYYVRFVKATYSNTIMESDKNKMALKEALDFAIESNDKEMSELLVEKGATRAINRSTIEEVMREEVKTDMPWQDAIILKLAGCKVEFHGSYTLYFHQDQKKRDRRVACIVSGDDWNGASNESPISTVFCSGYNIISFDARKNKEKKMDIEVLKKLVAKKNLKKLHLIVIDCHGSYRSDKGLHMVTVDRGSSVITADLITQIASLSDLKSVQCILNTCNSWSVLKDLQSKLQSTTKSCEVVALSQYESIDGKKIAYNTGSRTTSYVIKGLSKASLESPTLLDFTERFATITKKDQGNALYMKTYKDGKYILGEVVYKNDETPKFTTMEFGNSSEKFKRDTTHYLVNNSSLQSEVIRKLESEGRYKQKNNRSCCNCCLNVLYLIVILAVLFIEVGSRTKVSAIIR